MPNTIPSEFRSFVRDVGIRAFDRLAGRAGELDPSLRPIVRGWGKLSSEQKESLFDELIETAQLREVPADPPPARAPRSIKRYDPEEVEKTLPPKKTLKAKPKAKAKTAPKSKGKSSGSSKKRSPSTES